MHTLGSISATLPALDITSTPLLASLAVHIDWHLALAGALVGLLVGLTGMGGGALLTPILMLVFHVPPLAAVSSDLITSLVMKPFGGAVHLARGSVHRPLLRWLMLGSVPAAFAGSVAIGLLGHGSHAARVQADIKFVVALALLASVTITLLRLARDRRGPGHANPAPVVVRPGLTVAIGALGGLAVGLSSVGAGTLVIGMLLLAQPGLSTRELVGTDIVQAIPLVASAAFGHMLFGDVQLPLTASLLVGAIPAVLLGARFSSSAPSQVSRPVVSAVLLASALALLKVPASWLGLAAVAVVLLTVVLGRRPAPAAARPVLPPDAIGVR